MNFVPLFTLVFLLSFQIGCAGSPPEANPPEPQDQKNPDLDQEILEDAESLSASPMEEGNVEMKQTLTCTNGSESKVFTALTYASAQACDHPTALGEECLCEIINASTNGVWVYAQRSKNYCSEVLTTTLQTGTPNSGRFNHPGYETMGYTCTVE